MIWSDFGFENEWEPVITEWYPDVGPILFDKTLYWHAFQPRLAELTT